jgi:hypothetical protein
MEILRKNQKEGLEIKNSVIEVENGLGGHIHRLETAKKRISEFKNISIVTYKAEKKKKYWGKSTRTEYPKNVRQLQKV